MLYIHNATIITPAKTIRNGALLADGRKISALGPANQVPCPPEAEKIDANGAYLVPGFIDLQLNGGFQHDFTANPDTIWPVAEQLPQYGVTSFLPTIITSPLAQVERAMGTLRPSLNPSQREGGQILPPMGGDRGGSAIPLGLHLEGPFLNPGKKGAHNPAYLQTPSLEAIKSWTVENGVKLVTLAPELPGALPLISALAERGIVVSAGHSLATFAQAEAGFAAGIRYGTHLFNAMPSLHHREPGLIGALLADERLTVGLIPDGIHVHPALVKMAWEILGPRRMNLVTDAMAALGTPPGRYIIGNFEVMVDENASRLPNGTLAGSIISLDAALRNLIAFTGCSLEEALPTVASTPARLLGLSGQRGELAPGAFADLVLLSPELAVQMTVVEGKVVFN